MIHYRSARRQKNSQGWSAMEVGKLRHAKFTPLFFSKPCKMRRWKTCYFLHKTCMNVCRYRGIFWTPPPSSKGKQIQKSVRNQLCEKSIVEQLFFKILQETPFVVEWRGWKGKRIQTRLKKFATQLLLIFSSNIRNNDHVMWELL